MGEKRGILINFFVILVLLCFLSLSDGIPKANAGYDSNLFKAMKWRSIGPYRGGRVTCVTGVPGQPLVYYFGATGGGVWKTEDAGLTWNNISDGYFKTGSVGAIAVASSDPNVIYVGTGESCLRNDISPGDGVYKSEDAGKTWKNIGLSDSKHISRIRIHPEDPDLVYVAVLGHVSGINKERGIFRSKDGGQTWEKILFVDQQTGASDLSMDPTTPRILYAGMWQVNLTPWGIYSRGPGSGLYKSTNGGDNWVKLTEGLPKKTMGRIGIAVSSVKPDRVFSIIEAEDGGLFRSENGGKTWLLINDDFQLRHRPAYYTHVYADTQDADTVYVLILPFLKSVDGGKTFQRIIVPHGDNHDLWIAPEDNKRMINGNDGGTNVSFNGGKSWTRQDNQPTAQMYHVTTDNRFPYRVYGAQQDNSTISVPSRRTGRTVVPDMYPVAGGESGYIAVHPENPNISYGGSYWGFITRYDHSTKENREISPWPESPAGRPAAELKYRFYWTFPIVISPHDPNIIYAGSNVLFKSTNEGQSWEVISPDLTRNDKSKQQDGLVTQVYCTIFTVAESPLKKDLIWAGSDDGLVHITLDGGKNWQNVTPKEMPEWSRVSIIEASPHDAASAYFAANRFDLDDCMPYIFKTNDYGKTWKLITKGIPKGAFARVVREDPKRRGLLYAGTEIGVYVSFDDGESWQSLQINLPVVPIHDMVVKDDDLVAATHGRSFWILDDLTPLQQLTDKIVSSKFYLFKQRDTYRAQGYNAVIHYYLKDKPEKETTLDFLDAEGEEIKSFKPKQASPGINRFEWDMRYPDAIGVKGGSLIYGGSLRGPVAVPGTYQVRLTVDSESFTKSFEIKKDPRIEVTKEDLQKQFDLLIKIRDRLSDTHQAVNQILDMKTALEDAQSKIEDLERKKIIFSEAEKLKEKLNSVLNALVEIKVRSYREFNFYLFHHMFDHHRLKLNTRIGSIQGVVANAYSKPTDQCYENFNEASADLDIQLTKFKEIKKKDIPAFNRLVKE